MVLEINAGNGFVNVVPYTAYNGIKWQREDTDGPGAGRDLTDELRRNRIGTKRRLDVTCRLLTNDEVRIVLSLIMPEFVQVRYYDPQLGQIVVRTMYSNNNPASYQIKDRQGVEWWSGVTFPLIEK